MTALIELRPRGPYHLRTSLGPARDGTVRVRDGCAELAFDSAAGPAYARVSQQPDGLLRIALDAPDEGCALDRLRFLLAVDDDIGPFLALAERDSLLRNRVARARGLRAGRTGTCLHALVRAMAGQLITTREAWDIERAIVRRSGREHAGMMLSPTRDDLARLSAAQIAACGLAPRRASALVRVSRLLDLERLAAVPPEAAAARLLREPQLGPWTVGVVFLNGLGRYDRGLVGDLGLIKLCSSLLGRRAEAEDTAELLAPYGEWAGLASLHLLRAGVPARQERARRARTASA